MFLLRRKHFFLTCRSETVVSQSMQLRALKHFAVFLFKLLRCETPANRSVWDPSSSLQHPPVAPGTGCAIFLQHSLEQVGDQKTTKCALFGHCWGPGPIIVMQLQARTDCSAQGCSWSSRQPCTSKKWCTCHTHADILSSLWQLNYPTYPTFNLLKLVFYANSSLF